MNRFLVFAWVLVFQMPNQLLSRRPSKLFFNAGAFFLPSYFSYFFQRYDPWLKLSPLNQFTENRSLDLTRWPIFALPDQFFGRHFSRKSLWTGQPAWPSFCYHSFTYELSLVSFKYVRVWRDSNSDPLVSPISIWDIIAEAHRSKMISGASDAAKLYHDPAIEF